MSASAGSDATGANEEIPRARGRVAWCERCGHLVADAHPGSESSVDFHCPACGDPLVATAEDDAPPKAPWHFKVLLVGTICYLVYRLIWFILWLSHHA